MPRRSFRTKRTKTVSRDIFLITLPDVKKHTDEISDAISKVSVCDSKISQYQDEIEKHKKKIKNIEYKQKKIINQRKENMKHLQVMISKPPIFKHSYNLRSFVTNT